MCHSWMKRFIKWDRSKIFKFAPLESEAAKNYLSPILPGYIKEDTIVYYDNGKTYLRSDAALRIIKELGFPYSFLSFGKLVPKLIRDSVYKWVANHRYKFGERYETCPLPPVEWRDRFL
jgi:predicted DCC family thiol-disulfide oxidoreductase YuxK